jgi:hypothetical protein
LARLLDVPSSDTDQLIDWGNQMVGNTDPDYTDYLITDADSDKYKQYPFRTPSPSTSSNTAASWRENARAVTAPTW